MNINKPRGLWENSQQLGVYRCKSEAQKETNTVPTVNHEEAWLWSGAALD